ncbi:hypothetical protein NHX12_018994 [Muraenolepis orangiensis]|uniref:Uncharacterized protein n=1 Tax=Muraenolepis orangiensis TaxID=630683 RepID=A0A9Q0EVY6_9TELE|nr:hypothetical protein NHX12_018994 [Muraenolepis orangiensis]
MRLISASSPLRRRQTLSEAVYAVGNFKASEEDSPGPPRQVSALQKDHQLRVLSQHSLYRKTARSSESREDRREKASLASLKRASADVELLAPRGPMGKETMVTFSNTLPRAANGGSPVSPRSRQLSAKTRAKWLSLTDGGGAKDPGAGPIAVSTPRVPSSIPGQLPSQPRIMQVIAMSKQQAHGGPMASSSPPKSSDTGSSHSSESPYYRLPSDRDSGGGSNPGSNPGSIVTVDAHAPHHPVVRVSTAANGKPWEWRNTISGHMISGGVDASSSSSVAAMAGGLGDKHHHHHRSGAGLQRQDPISQYRDYRTLPAKKDFHHHSIHTVLPPPPHPDLLMDTHGHAPLGRSSTLPRRPAVSGHGHPEQEHYYRAMQDERML